MSNEFRNWTWYNGKCCRHGTNTGQMANAVQTAKHGETGGACRKRGNAYTICVEKTWRIESPGKSRHRWEDNIKKQGYSNSGCQLVCSSIILMTEERHYFFFTENSMETHLHYHKLHLLHYQETVLSMDDMLRLIQSSWHFKITSIAYRVVSIFL